MQAKSDWSTYWNVKIILLVYCLLHEAYHHYSYWKHLFEDSHTSNQKLIKHQWKIFSCICNILGNKWTKCYFSIRCIKLKLCIINSLLLHWWEYILQFLTWNPCSFPLIGILYLQCTLFSIRGTEDVLNNASIQISCNFIS